MADQTDSRVKQKSKTDQIGLSVTDEPCIDALKIVQSELEGSNAVAGEELGNSDAGAAKAEQPAHERTADSEYAGEKAAEEGIEPSGDVLVDSRKNLQLSSKHKPILASNRGLIRHRLVIAGCVALAASIFGLSIVDLRPLISREATIDKSFHVEYTKDKPALAGNLAYVSDTTLGYLSEADPPSDNGFRQVSESTWGGVRMGFVDSTGKVVVKPIFQSVENFHEGLAAVKLVASSSWGYIDTTGKLVIPAQFYSAGSFKDGVAPVLTPHKGGNLIDRNGNLLLQAPPQGAVKLENRHHRTRNGFEKPSRFGNFYEVSNGSEAGLVDKEGHWILPLQVQSVNRFSRANRYADPLSSRRSAQVDDEYYRIFKSSRYGVVDRNGKIVMPPLFDDVLSFSNGHAAVRVDNQAGFADASGKIVIEPKYRSVTPFDKLIAVHEGKKWHLIDSSGKRLSAATFDGVILDESGGWLSEGYGAIIRNGKCGFVNDRGQIVIKPKFPFVREFREGYAPVWTGTFWRLIDRTGRFASPYEFGKISEFNKGEAAATMPEWLYPIAKAQDIENTNRSVQSLTHWLAGRDSGTDDSSEPVQSDHVE